MTMSSSAASATSVSYTFTSAALPSATILNSIELQICDTASGSCTHTGNANGFSASSSTLHAGYTGLGGSSWIVDATSQYALRVKYNGGGNATAPSGTVSIEWDNVTNPSASNATFYIRMTTYSGTAYTGAVDTGTVAVSTASQITLNGTMDESLTFCVGGTVGATCASPTSGNLTFANHFTTANPVDITSQMAAATNGSFGYNITYTGTTLTCSGCSGSPTITAMGTQSPNGSATTSSAGTSQFGLNVVANTISGAQPGNSFGANISHNSGNSFGTNGTNYGTAQSFRFFTGDTIGTSSQATDFDQYTVSYLVNVPAFQAAGNYTTTLTYICTANF